ncbi:MAG: hypothetical protein AAGE52_18350 [Myxococcota bacterium]
MPTHDSVLVALRELQDIETHRIETEHEVRRAEADAERAAAEEAQKQADAARAAKEAAAKHARQVAAEEAKHNVDAIVAERTKDSDARLQAMQSELAAIVAERKILHARMTEPVDEVPPPRRGLPVAFALSVLMCAALATVVTVQALRPEPVPSVVIREVEVPVPAAPVAAVAEAPVVEAEAAVVEEAAPAPRTRTVRPRVRTETRMSDRHDMAFDAMERCGDDPLCMLGD